MTFNQETTKKIINCFGKDFYERLQLDLPNMIKKWQLSSCEVIDSYSASLVFRCESKSHGQCILKVCRSLSGLRYETQALKHFSKDKMCALYDYDETSNMLLEERIEPGITLRDEKDVDKRLDIFIKLYKDSHVTCADDCYDTYQHWVSKITDFMRKQSGFSEMTEAMCRAKKIYDELSLRYNKNCLLHGDFHHDNILLNHNNRYKIIDPKGVIGDPVFDMPRYILNEFWFEEKNTDLKEKLLRIIQVFSTKLDISVQDVKALTYVETIMGACWCIEDGADDSLYKSIIETKRFLENEIMNV